MRVRIRVVAALCACALGTACSAAGQSSDLSAAAQATLQSDVLALTRAAAAHHWSAAEHALAVLRTDLAAAVAANEVSAERAQSIRVSMDDIATDIAAKVPTRTATPTTTAPSSHRPPPPAPPKPDSPPKEHGKHKGHDD